MQFFISYHFCENGTHKRLPLHMSISLCISQTLLLSLLAAKHSLEMKVLLFQPSRSGRLMRVAKGDQCRLKWEIKHSM